MTQLIAVESIRDCNLSQPIMQTLGLLIEAENLSQGFDVTHYVTVPVNGVVNQAALVLIENNVASVIWQHGVSCAMLEEVVRANHSHVRYISMFFREEKAIEDGWSMAAVNYRSRITARTTNYHFQDTGNPIVKRCITPVGELVCTVLPGVMSVILTDSNVSREAQKHMDVLAGVAVSEGRTFTVQTSSLAWLMAMRSNPNYVFNNCTYAKDLWV